MIKRKCLRCDYKWIPRIDKIKTCPKCKTRFWNLPPKEKSKLDKEIMENEKKGENESGSI